MIFIPEHECTAEIEMKRSRFISTVHKVISPEEAKLRVQKVREEYSDSTHVVWAFATGEENSQTMGMSDDGEPKGTAGKPTLALLQYGNITNTLITTVRYFGGTKLGTGGLVKAYTDAAQSALQNTRLKELVEEVKVTIAFAYKFTDGVKQILQHYSCKINNEQFTENVQIVFIVPVIHKEKITVDLIDETAGTVVFSEPDN